MWYVRSSAKLAAVAAAGAPGLGRVRWRGAMTTAAVAPAVPPPVRLQPTFQNEALADPNLKKQVDDPVDGSLRYLAISPDVPPLDNIHYRLAVFYAINKEAWRLAFGGAVSGVIANSLTPSGLPGHDDKANKYPNGADSGGDLNKARQELAACGQPNGFSTNLAFQNQGTGRRALPLSRRRSTGSVSRSRRRPVRRPPSTPTSSGRRRA
jgi:ABC-type transport system substrate-binding protein